MANNTKRYYTTYGTYLLLLSEWFPSLSWIYKLKREHKERNELQYSLVVDTRYSHGEMLKLLYHTAHPPRFHYCCVRSQARMMISIMKTSMLPLRVHTNQIDPRDLQLTQPPSILSTKSARENSKTLTKPKSISKSTSAKLWRRLRQYKQKLSPRHKENYYPGTTDWGTCHSNNCKH